MMLPEALPAADAPSSFFDEFESGDTAAWDYTGLWGSSSTVSTRYLGKQRGYALKATAEGAAKRVGKAYLTKDMQPAHRGDRIEASMLVYLPYLPPRAGSVYLLDLECRDCGYSEKPGLRVFIGEDGYLGVSRSKLGLSENFASTPEGRVPYDKAFRLTVIVELGGDDDGRTLVYIDDHLAIDEVGVNMPLNEVFQPLGVTLTAERFDYLQFGVTANSRSDAVTAFFDDVEIEVFSGS
jgi:hypothetical protein